MGPAYWRLQRFLATRPLPWSSAMLTCVKLTHEGYWRGPHRLSLLGRVDTEADTRAKVGMGGDDGMWMREAISCGRLLGQAKSEGYVVVIQRRSEVLRRE